MTENGAIGAKVIERTLSNGVTVRTSPLSPYANARFMRLTEEKYPDADRKPFLSEHPDSVLPVLDEKGWLSAQNEVLIARNNLWSEFVVSACVEVIGSEEEYIAAYAKQIARLRKHLELPEDPWSATLLYGLLENRDDVNALLRDAQGITPLSAPEVADGLRVFRPQLHESAIGDAQS